MRQTLKPRARWMPDLWMVHGMGISIFDSTLDGALRMWHACILLGQTHVAP